MSSKIKACVYQRSTPMCRWYYWASDWQFLPFHLLLLVPMRINGREEFLILVHKNRESWCTLHSIDGTRTYHAFLFFSQFGEVLVFFFNNQCRLSVPTCPHATSDPKASLCGSVTYNQTSCVSPQFVAKPQRGGPRHSRKPVAVTTFKPSPEKNLQVP